MGEIKPGYADVLRDADAIFIQELREANLYDQVSQAFAVYLPVKSVGVVGDTRRYEHVIALQGGRTIDFMTARWARLPYEFIEHVSNRIINEIAGVSRVVYDISSKPPATIEWGNDAYAKISTYLAADLETVKDYLMTPALLNYVVAGLMKFHPIEPNFFPSKWVEGSSL